jgi:predicted transcriptional regulator
MWDRHLCEVSEYNKMAQSLLEIAKDLTHTLVETGRLSAEDMQDTLQSTYAMLATLKAQEESGNSTMMPLAEASPMDWRKSITRQTITCLECGQTFKQLSIRHLGIHGLDTRSYRTKYGIPRTQPLTARATTERRRQVVREIRPWEKTPTYRQGQAHHGHAAPEPEAEVLPEEPRAAAPARPKRQHKTTPKKTARKIRSDA